MFKSIRALLGRTRHISRADVSEDLRKIGIAGIISGLIGAFAGGDRLSLSDGLFLAAVGVIIWVTGLIIRRKSS